MWSIIYELLGAPNDNALQDLYREDIYWVLGVFLLSMIIFPASYYFLFNRILFAKGITKKPLDKLKHWMIFLILMSITLWTISFFYIKWTVKDSYDGDFEEPRFAIWAATLNLLWGLILFVFVSLLFKKGSLYAKNVPL